MAYTPADALAPAETAPMVPLPVLVPAAALSVAETVMVKQSPAANGALPAERAKFT
jgi:hypothetical protein